MMLDNRPMNFSAFGDISKLKSTRHRVLFALYFTEKEFGINELSTAQITELINDKMRFKTSPQMVDGAIRSAGDMISTTKKEKIKYHKIMSPGVSEIAYSFPTKEKDEETKKILDLVIPKEVIEKEKGYFKKVVLQINGCYQDGYYDACFVMVRRAIETLIVEVYEKLGDENEIKDDKDNYFPFSKLVNKTLEKREIRLSKNVRSDIKAIKKFGDSAAHNRRLNLKKPDIDKYSDSVRMIVEELINNK